MDYFDHVDTPAEQRKSNVGGSSIKKTENSPGLRSMKSRNSPGKLSKRDSIDSSLRAKDLNQNSSTAMGTGLGHIASQALLIDTDTPSNALLHNQSIE